MLEPDGFVHEYFSEQLGDHVKKSFRLISNPGLPVGPVPLGYKRQEDNNCRV